MPRKKDEQRPLSRQDIKEIFNESFSEYQAREKEKKRTIRKLKPVWRKETEWIREKLQQKITQKKERDQESDLPG